MIACSLKKSRNTKSFKIKNNNDIKIEGMMIA